MMSWTALVAEKQQNKCGQTPETVSAPMAEIHILMKNQNQDQQMHTKKEKQ